MRECEQQYDDILAKIEEMGKKREESGVQPMISVLAGKVDQTTMAVDNLASVVTEVKTAADETHKELFGNGDIEGSLKHKFILLAQDFNRHIDDADKKEERRWNIAKPLIVDFLKMIFFGGSAGGLFYALTRFLVP